MKTLLFVLLTILSALPVAAIIPDNGDFRLRFEPPKSAQFRKLALAVRDSKIFFEVYKAINDTIALPRDVPVVFAECGEENAAYDQDTNEIVVCYEMISRFGKMFAADKDNSPEKIGKLTLEATMFIVFHETGHALVHELDLPVTGKEEDAVDDLAGIIALHLGEGSEEILLAALQAFADFAQEEETGNAEDLAFWDEHSLSSQRVYSIACMLVGKDPETFSELIGDDGLPQERADKCPDEFTQKSNSWDRLLRPFFKGDSTITGSNQPVDTSLVAAEPAAAPVAQPTRAPAPRLPTAASEPEETQSEETGPEESYSRPFQAN